MLPKQYKFTSPVEFDRTIRRGRRAGSHTLVVHLWDAPAEDCPAVTGGPRFGLIVSKAVGNAVVRHRTSRRLRHVCGRFVDELPRTAHVVIRALPAAGGAGSVELARDLSKAIGKLQSRARTR